jgi:hypothetical protein
MAKARICHKAKSAGDDEARPIIQDVRVTFI